MTSYTFRLDDDLKTRSFDVFKNYGLSPAQAIKLFLTQVAETRTVPLSLDYEPNLATSQLLQRVKNGTEPMTQVKNIDELMDALNA